MFSLTMLFAIIAGVSLSITIFMCLRQKCSKKKKLPDINIDRVDTVDDTPAKAAPSADSIRLDHSSSRNEASNRNLHHSSSRSFDQNEDSVNKFGPINTAMQTNITANVTDNTMIQD